MYVLENWRNPDLAAGRGRNLISNSQETDQSHLFEKLDIRVEKQNSYSWQDIPGKACAGYRISKDLTGAVDFENRLHLCRRAYW